MRVTVGIPFFNNESTLADAIRSVYAQTFTDWELILLDDGSRDGSLAIAQAVASVDPRVHIIFDGVNRKVPYRRNQAAQLARGDYVAYLDADDLMHPCRLEKQVAYMELHPEVQVLGAATYTIDRQNQITGVRNHFPLSTRPDSVLEHGLYIMSSVIAWTSWWRENPFDESFARAQDHELWCRTYASSIFAKIEEPLIYLRETHRNPRAYLKLYLLNCKYNRKLYRKYGGSLVGKAQTRRLILRTYLKGEVYRCATMLGLQSWLVRRRNNQLTPQEQMTAMNMIDRILHTAVPGLSPVRA